MMNALKISLLAPMILVFASQASAQVIFDNTPIDLPAIMGDRIATVTRYNGPSIFDPLIDSGKVWDASTGKMLFKAGHTITLGKNSMFFVNGANTFIYSKAAQKVAEIPGTGYLYDFVTSYIWRLASNKLVAYSEAGVQVASMEINGSNVRILANEVLYIRSGSLYKRLLDGSPEQLIGPTAGTFKTWFQDGGYFITQQSDVIRIYSRAGVVVKIFSMPVNVSLDGSGEYYWVRQSGVKSVKLYKVNTDDEYVYECNFFFPAPNSFGFKSLTNEFFIVDLSLPTPSVIAPSGMFSGVYTDPTRHGTFNADLDGNWVAWTFSEIIVYGNFHSSEPVKRLNRKVNIYTGNKTGSVFVNIATESSFKWTFENGAITATDPLTGYNGIKMSDDGLRLATTFTDQNSSDVKLGIYDIDGETVLKTIPQPLAYNISPSGNLLTYKLADNSNVIESVDGSPVVLSTDNTIIAPMASPDDQKVMTLFANYSGIPDEYLTKIYSSSGTLLNALSGFAPGWIANDRFFFNQMEPLPAHQDEKFSLHVYNSAGQEDASYKIPTNMDPSFQPSGRYPIRTVGIISDHEFLINQSIVIDTQLGQVIFRFDKVPTKAFVIGSDHILFELDGFVRVVDWRATRKTWYFDNDGDGYGDETKTILAQAKPPKWVSNKTDCDDSNSEINVAAKWYADSDGDGAGNPEVSVTQCVKPTGYVQNMLDCDDTNPVLDAIICVTGTADEIASSLYPNPGNGIYYLKHNDKEFEIKVFSSQGKETSARISRDSENYFVDLSSSSDGLYLFRVDVNGTVSSQKVIKN